MKKISRIFFATLVCVYISGVLKAQITFTGPELLGKPTDQSIAANIVPDADIEYYYVFGTVEGGPYTDSTLTSFATAGQPAEIVIDGLTGNTRYYYRLVYREGGGTWIYRDEHTFVTQRAKGNPFVFTITSDSHAQLNASHRQAMKNVLNDNPDFHLDLGDTFYPDNATGQSQVDAGYLAYRDTLYMGAIGHSSPVFLTPGNHENEEGWNLDDYPFSIGVASIQSRKSFYPTPTPDGFYSGDDSLLTDIDEMVYGDELREDYYAWEWGDALFIVLDEYQYTTELPYTPVAGEGNDDIATGDQWSWTLGKKQFDWFKQTLQNSDAKYKFVFSHHVTGGIPNLNIAGVGPGYVRGGAGAANYFEWGGQNADGSWGFDDHRPGWGGVPIHQLMVENGVSAYFHGHDHQYVYEIQDGIVYQEVPSPSMSGSGFSGIYSESDSYTIEMLPNAGHLRVNITPAEATVEYVRSNITEVSYSYTIEPNGSSSLCDLILNVNPGEGGTTIPEAGTHSYNKNELVTIAAIPAEGYVFDHWGSDVTDPNSSVTTVLMDENQSVTAYFTESSVTPGVPLYRVNCGGPALDMDPDPDFEALQYSDLTTIEGLTVGGITAEGSTTDAIDLLNVEAGLPEALFQTILRTGASGTQTMTFDFEVPNGNYNVLLHWAEHNSDYADPGDRVFDIFIEGEEVLPDYDIAVAAGGEDIAVTETVFTTVTDGILNLAISRDVSVAIIRGIEIVTADAGADVIPPVITLIGDEEVIVHQGEPYTDAGAIAIDNIDGNLTPAIVVGGDPVDVNTKGDYIITYNVSDAAGNPAVEVTRTVHVINPFVTGVPLYRVNCGGPELDMEPDPDFEALRYSDLTTIQGLTVGGITAEGSTTDAIDLSNVEPGLPEALFQTILRTSASGTQTMTFDFEVPEGSYKVLLHWAEHNSDYADPGDRVFDIFIEGEEVLPDYDIALATGGEDIAVTETIYTSVTDGILNLAIARDVSVAIIRGIEIVPVEDIPEPGISLSENSLEFITEPGTLSEEQSYTVSGSSLTEDIVITAPSDFEISVTSGSGFGSSLTLPETGGNVNPTTIYVRFNRADEGNSVGNIIHSSGDQVQNLTLSGIAINSGTITYHGNLGSAVSESSSGTLAIITEKAVNEGDDIIIGFTTYGDPDYTVSITDASGNEYAEAAQSICYAHGRTYIFAAFDVNALPEGSSILINHTEVDGATAAVATVFSGLAEIYPIDQSLGNPAPGSEEEISGSVATAGPTGMTLQSTELIIGVMGTEGPVDDDAGTWDNSFFTGPRAGSVSSANNWTVSLGFRMTTEKGEYTARKSGMTDRYWAAAIATFKTENNIPSGTANVLLSRPADNSVHANVIMEQDGEIYFEYGTVTGDYSAGQTAVMTVTAGTPAGVPFSGLTADTKYYYRLQFKPSGETVWNAGDECTFRTQRSEGETFTFTLTSDSHLGQTFSGISNERYEQTTLNIEADNPDFHIDLGDAFIMDEPDNQDEANQIYFNQRQYFGNFSHSVPVYIAIGNHENEEGWNFDDTPVSKALLSIIARKQYFPNPVSDGFYTGNDDLLPEIGGDQLREDYYAWEWGNALFIVLDPFQYTMVKPYSNIMGSGEDNDETISGDQWNWTLGAEQYNWFRDVLENSDAEFKYVFAHHIVGGQVDVSGSAGVPEYVRGGGMAVPYFEWGGNNADDTWGYDTERSGWTNPIHELMVANGVSAFFHGHDHQFAHEMRDDIVYQLVPSSSMEGYGFDLYNSSPYLVSRGSLPNAGHLRVTVSSGETTVEYIRSEEGGGGINGEVSYDYIIAPPESIRFGGLPMEEFICIPNEMSAEQSYIIAGSGLTDDIIITAPEDFEISTISGSGFGTSLVISQNNGIVPLTRIYVRFSIDTDGSTSGNITHESAGVLSQNILVTGSSVVWENSDIGEVSATGSYERTGGEFTIRGSGKDIWETSDEFHYVYQSVNEDIEIIGHLLSMDNTNDWAKAGLMIRETLDDNSKHALIAISPDDITMFQSRSTTGGGMSSTNETGNDLPVWLKLYRTGNIITGEVSSDGVNWNTIGSISLSMNSEVYAGMFVCSHNDGILNTAVFDNVSITGDEPIPVTGISVVPERVEIYVGQSVQLITEIAPINASDKSVTWDSDNLSVVSVSTSGLILGESVGTASITVTTNDGGFIDICEVTINEKPQVTWENTDIGSVAATGSFVEVNGQFTIEGSGKDIWQSSDEFHYVYQSVNEDIEIIGHLLSMDNTNDWAKAGLMIRETLDDNSKHALIAMTPDDVTIFQSRITTGGGMSSTNETGNDLPVWLKLYRTGNIITGEVSSDGVNWNTIGSISLSMNSEVYAGMFVCSHNDGILNTAIFDNVSITGDEPILVSGIEVTPEIIEISVNQDVKLNAEVLPFNATNKNVLWSSDNPLVVSVSENGVIKGESEGMAIVTATSEDGGFTDNCEVSVSVVEVTGITVNPKILELYIGHTYSLNAEIVPSDATNQTVLWESDNPLIASVSPSSGQITAKSTGTTFITATTEDGGFTDYCEITISEEPPVIWENTDIGSVAAAGDFIESGGEFTITGSGRDIWETSDEFHYVYQSVDGDMEIIVRLLAMDNTNIWAKAGLMIRETLDANSKHALVAMTPDNISVFQSRSITGGGMVSTQTTGYNLPIWLKLNRTGNVIKGEISADGINWITLGSRTINMNENVWAGLFICSHNDGVLNTAVLDNVSLTGGEPIAVEGVSVVPENVEVYIDQSVLLEALVIPGNASNKAVVWSSDNPSIASVSTTTGLVTGESSGVTIITATTDDGGFTANCEVSVSEAPPIIWENTDIGTVAAPGSVIETAGQFIIEGSGKDIWQSSDEFHYVYQQVNDDVEIIVRLMSMDNTNIWAKAGLMIRETLNDNSKHAIIAMTPDNISIYQARGTTGGGMISIEETGYSLPIWLKLSKNGNVITGEVSIDGINWNTVGTRTISMNSVAYAGMFVCSHNDGILNTAVFNNVSLLEINPKSIEYEITDAQPVDNEIIIYPNPSNGEEITISFHGLKDDLTQIKIFDVTGAQLYSVNVKSDNERVTYLLEDINFNSGIYLIKVIQPGLSANKWIIVGN